MSSLSTVLRYELWFFIVVLALIVTYQLLTRKINMEWLLYDDERNFSPGRLQLLMSTLAVASYYLLEVLSHPGAAKFPEIPNDLLLILGGSNLFYLGGKLSSLIEDKLGSMSSRAQSGREDPTQKKGG